MSKRLPIILIIALCAGSIIYLLSKNITPGNVEKPKPSARAAVTKTRDPILWDHMVGERPDRKSLETLRTDLLAMTAAEAVAEIEKFLASGKDSSTGLEFEIGSGGTMKGWPTLRVYLLDLLLEIDPAAAMRIGRGILAESTTADEWALALRNVARGEADNLDFLRTKTEELIANPQWQAKPSVGYLNSFDVLVHTGATASSPLLSGLIRDKDRRDLAHAAFLTFDRLVQREPVEMLKRLQSDKALQESRPEMTAQQFARADLRDETQRGLVKTWLLDPSRTPTELRNFAGIFPNNNQMISNNLLTSEKRVSGEVLREHDREVLAILKDWRGDVAFKAVSDYLGTMEGRLSQFVKGAEK